MNKNKQFIGITLIALILGFAGLAYIYNSQNQPPPAPVISSADLIKDHSPRMGPADAQVQFVEFLDPECEACRVMDPIVKGLVKEFEGKILFVVRYMPFHENSKFAAVHLEETRDSGRYWEALSNLFYKQPEWGSHQNPRPDLIPGFLKEMGFDLPTSDVLMEKHGWKVDIDAADGKKVGVKGTPTFFINGKIVNDISYTALKSAIQAELNSK